MHTLETCAALDCANDPDRSRFHTVAARYVCKRCGAESPAGIGYAATTAGPMPAPAAGCPNPHA
jgi:hypothetical protein